MTERTFSFEFFPPKTAEGMDKLRATREHQRVRLGASTRGGVALVSLAKAFSFMAGRDYVAPHDIARAALSALPHRLVMAGSERAHAADVVAECIAAVQAPRR